MARSIIITILSAAIIFGAFQVFKSFTSKKKEARKLPPISLKSVYVETVNNEEVPVKIDASGQLVATRRVTLTSEVTGVLRSSNFKEGVSYRNGQVIFTIDNAETNTSVASQRSVFYSTLLKIMPDLKLDYPDVWQKWDIYLKSIDIDQNLPELPAFTTDRERNFITANGIITAFQNAKNLEIRSGKYRLKAPFNGVITQANVQEGSLVTMNQPLGEISSLGDYELELPVNVEFLYLLKVGQQIELSSINNDKTYKGKIVRINPRADINSQSITAYIRVVDRELREGMFLKAVIDAGTIDNAYEIDRKLINSSNEVFIVTKDSTLQLVKVNPVYSKEETSIVEGLEDSIQLLSKVLPGAYPGMKVKILSNQVTTESE